jgi:hypothetical protein
MGFHAYIANNGSNNTAGGTPEPQGRSTRTATHNRPVFVLPAAGIKHRHCRVVGMDRRLPAHDRQ